MHLPKNLRTVPAAVHLQRDHYLRATSRQSRVVYLARLTAESKLPQEVEYDDIIKTFVEKGTKSVFEAIVTFAPISEIVNCLHIISD